VTTHVRIYRIRPGALEAFVDEWRTQVAPLRRRHGFEIHGAWASVDDDTFVWIVGHEGDFAAADRAYYESPERKALEPDPARHILEPRSFLARPVPLP
jgi:NIPSNAP